MKRDGKLIKGLIEAAAFTLTGFAGSAGATTTLFDRTVMGVNYCAIG